MEGNLHFEIDWASLTVEGKFTVFALFYFVFEGNIPSTSPRGAYIWRGLCMEGLILYVVKSKGELRCDINSVFLTEKW